MYKTDISPELLDNRLSWSGRRLECVSVFARVRLRLPHPWGPINAHGGQDDNMTTRLATCRCKNVRKQRTSAREADECARCRRTSQLWVSVLHLVANFKTVELFNNTRKKRTSAFPLWHVSMLQHETPAAELTRGTQTDGGEHHQAVSECLPHTHALSQTYHKHPGQRKYTLANWCEKHREKRVL